MANIKRSKEADIVRVSQVKMSHQTVSPFYQEGHRGYHGDVKILIKKLEPPTKSITTIDDARHAHNDNISMLKDLACSVSDLVTLLWSFHMDPARRCGV
jgi:hypothetical protein